MGRVKCGEATKGPPCPECGWATVAGVGDTNPHCPIHLRWLAVRLEPPPTSPARRGDEAWFEAHPEAGERVRPLTLDEQVRAFWHNGAAVTHVRVIRTQSRALVGGRLRTFYSVVGGEYW